MFALQMIAMKRFLQLLSSTVICICIVAVGATLNSSDISLSLKGQPIPTNGTGVVIFQDIGGYLGAMDGLICMANSSDFISQYWSYPNKTFITKLPSPGVLGTSKCNINNGGSLYYSGMPTERGQFQCIFETSQDPSHVQQVNISVYIVDMNITGPNLTWPGEVVIAGEEVEFSINVTTFPGGVFVPYQWVVNGTKLENNAKYQGTQTDVLTILNAQDEDKGTYTCLVANSASGINVNPRNLVVVTFRITLSGSNIYPQTTKSYTLSCQLTGDERLSDLEPEYEYSWLKDGQFFSDSKSASIYTFNSLEFDDAGNYQCQVFVTFNRRLNRETVNTTSPQFQLLYPVALYRIYLNITTDCHEWTSTPNMLSKRNDINSHIIQGIKDTCKDVEVKDDVITNYEHAFGCPSVPNEIVVYSALLHGNELTNTSILVLCLDNWVKSTPVVVIDEVDIKVNKECTGVVDDLNSALTCGNTNTRPGITLGQGGIAAIVFGGLLVISIIFIIVLIKRYRQKRKGYENIGAKGEGEK